ncbi:MAG: hypothetical protein Q4C15_11775 [Eubacteriales bacterium]|nr:hypothetical protein [Eubacteriales bacterium]
MLNGMKAKALLIGTMAISILISGCGVKKDSDDKVMLEIGDNITEVTSDGQKNLLDISNNKATYWQYDSSKNLLISSKRQCSNVSIYNVETGAETVIGFPEVDDSHSLIEYEGQEMHGLNAWYEDGKVNIYAQDSDDRTLVVFTFDCENGELVDTARYDIESPVFVRETGKFIVYVKSVSVKDQNDKYYIKYDLNLFDKTTGEDKTVASDIGKLGKGFDLIVLNCDKSKVLFVKNNDWSKILDKKAKDTPVLYEYDIPSGETREVYKCSKGNCITGFTYASESNKIYLRYGKIISVAVVDYNIQPNHTTVITPDGRNYDLHSSIINGYDINTTGIVVY